MAPLLKNLLGNGSKDRELAEDLRAILAEMQEERRRCEAAIERTRSSADQLQQLEEPITKAHQETDAVSSRLGELERRITAFSSLIPQLEEAQVTATLEDLQRIRAGFEDFNQRVEQAMTLKDRIDGFMETEKPIEQLRAAADTLRGQVEASGEQTARLREQHERLLDAHKLAVQKMEALDRRREGLSRDMQDKERRIAGVEQGLQSMDGIQHTLVEVRRDVGTLKALADFVAQKSAALEAQREGIESALTQAEQLDRSMRQIDQGVRQQQAYATTLAGLQEQVTALNALHETVVDRSHEITQLQRETDERTRTTRQELAAVQEQMKQAVERFDFESHGLESVSQRVADLRSALTDFEARFKGLSESSQTVAELRNQTQSVGTQLRTLAGEIGQVDAEMAKLRSMRRDLDEMGRTAREAGSHVQRIEQSRPSVEAALRDLGQLGNVHAMVRDALEQAQLAHNEISRTWESQAETRSWLASTSQSVRELKDQLGQLHGLAPRLEFVQNQTHHVLESLTTLENKHSFAESLHRQISETGSLGASLEERSRQLQSRMETAEQQFGELGAQAEEAQRLSQTVADVTAQVTEAARRGDEIRKAVEVIGDRCETVEALAEKTRSLRDEIDQRQNSLEETAKKLKTATQLRQEATTSAQKLEELAEQLGQAVEGADQRATQVATLAGQIEDRASDLKAVEKRLDQFEERLGEWNLVEQGIVRSLEQISARQGTIESLQADLTRMSALAEKTVTDVREIMTVQGEVEESRELLKDVMVRLQEMRATTHSLDERARQTTKAEERLARAEGLLADVRSSLEALQGQKAIVDQAVEKAGSLRILLKQAEAMIEGLREEREITSRIRAAVGVVSQEEEDEDDEEPLAKAA